MMPGLDAKPLKRPMQKRVRALQDQVPTGVSFPFRGTSAPTGYLLEDGSAVSRRDYAALFAVIGTTYGVGDGSTTFNLPDSRNRFPVGAGGLYAVASTGGSKDAIVVSHNHTYSGTTSSDGNHSHEQSTGFVGTFGTGGSGATIGAYNGTNTGSRDVVSAAGTHSHTYSGSTSTDGASGTNANLPPYLATHWIIKT